MWFFGKIIENLRKHGNIKLVTTEKRKDHLVSEPNYHTAKLSTGNVLPIKLEKLKLLWISLFI